jgi:hypothetical protein
LKEEITVRNWLIGLGLSVAILAPVWSSAIPWSKTDHLFVIERSKNKNCVEYVARVTENDDLQESSPVAVYWILENGRQKDLSLIEKKYAYGIHSEEKLEKNRFKILLAALKDREIILEKVGASFKAIANIDGQESILEKIYVKTKEGLIGLPKVLYVDVFGRTKETSLPVKERIIPD